MSLTEYNLKKAKCINKYTYPDGLYKTYDDVVRFLDKLKYKLGILLSCARAVHGVAQRVGAFNLRF